MMRVKDLIYLPLLINIFEMMDCAWKYSRFRPAEIYSNLWNPEKTVNIRLFFIHSNVINLKEILLH